MYAQFHKHNQCAEWRHWYSVEGKKISLLFLSYGKGVNGPYHTKSPSPPPAAAAHQQAELNSTEQPNIMQLLLDRLQEMTREESRTAIMASAGEFGGPSLRLRGSAPSFNSAPGWIQLDRVWLWVSTRSVLTLSFKLKNWRRAESVW